MRWPGPVCKCFHHSIPFVCSHTYNVKKKKKKLPAILTSCLCSNESHSRHISPSFVASNPPSFQPCSEDEGVRANICTSSRESHRRARSKVNLHQTVPGHVGSGREPDVELGRLGKAIAQIRDGMDAKTTFCWSNGRVDQTGTTTLRGLGHLHPPKCLFPLEGHLGAGLFGRGSCPLYVRPRLLYGLGLVG